MKKLILISLFLFTYPSSLFADSTHFIDFTKVLNFSKPGAEAQKKLKTKFQTETKKFDKIEQDIRKEESEIISKKKDLSAEEYKKKVQVLRKKVAEMQKNKQNSLNSISKSRNDSKKALLQALNPIIKKYMTDNKIRMVLDKKGVILGDTTLEITDKIIMIVNKEVPSLKIN
jgi:Skp family chaperone for outer membrane proteins